MLCNAYVIPGCRRVSQLSPTTKTPKTKMPRRKADSDTEMEDGDEYEENVNELPTKSGKGRALAKNKRRVSMLKDLEGPSASGASGMGSVNSVDSSDLTANDDITEKRRRRQSTRPAVTFPDEDGDGAGPSSSGAANGSGPRTPKKSAVARANMLNAVDHTPLPAVSLDVMTSNFEEWMKMATDNVSEIHANATILTSGHP